MQRMNICVAGGILASLFAAGCTADGALNERASGQVARPADAVIFISGMS